MSILNVGTFRLISRANISTGAYSQEQDSGTCGPVARGFEQLFRGCGSRCKKHIRVHKLYASKNRNIQRPLQLSFIVLL